MKELNNEMRKKNHATELLSNVHWWLLISLSENVFKTMTGYLIYVAQLVEVYHLLL